MFRGTISRPQQHTLRVQFSINHSHIWHNFTKKFSPPSISPPFDLTVHFLFSLRKLYPHTVSAVFYPYKLSWAVIQHSVIISSCLLFPYKLEAILLEVMAYRADLEYATVASPTALSWHNIHWTASCTPQKSSAWNTEAPNLLTPTQLTFKQNLSLL